MENKLSPQYGKALELHNKILVSAQLAQNSLWDMCAGLKEMRDGKLYKELGYQNFEDYCGTEFNMSRRNAYRYISVIENCPKENVTSGSHFGIKKLYLLSTLSESEQEKLTAENDVESMTVKQLEAQVKKLKEENEELEKAVDNSDLNLERAKKQIKYLEEEKQVCLTTIDRQAAEIKEYESRPIEVAVAEPSEDVRQLKLTIKNLERTSEEQLDRVQEEHIAAERRLRQEHAKELERELAEHSKQLEHELTEQANAYEKKLAEARQAGADDRQVFKAYFTAAFDTFHRMLDFAKQSADKPFFKEKINNLITTLATANENM